MLEARDTIEVADCNDDGNEQGFSPFQSKNIKIHNSLSKIHKHV